MSRLVDLWPRRAPGLPPGQRRLQVFPRFGDAPRRRPPASIGTISVRVDGDGVAPFTLGPGQLEALDRVEAVHDFHCVTTWSYCGVRWGGWPMAAVWEHVVAPALDPTRTIRFALVRGADRYRSILALEDLLGPDVLLATTLDGEALDLRHGAPLRLVSPAQYGYKSVKHVTAIELHEHQPAGGLGAKEHLRARVALEERHSRWSGRLLRLPYRALVPATAIVAERALATAASTDGGSGSDRERFGAAPMRRPQLPKISRSS